MATIGQLMNRDLSVITEDTTVKQLPDKCTTSASDRCW